MAKKLFAPWAVVANIGRPKRSKLLFPWAPFSRKTCRLWAIYLTELWKSRISKLRGEWSCMFRFSKEKSPTARSLFLVVGPFRTAPYALLYTFSAQCTNFASRIDVKFRSRIDVLIGTTSYSKQNDSSKSLKTFGINCHLFRGNEPVA